MENATYRGAITSSTLNKEHNIKKKSKRWKYRWPQRYLKPRKLLVVGSHSPHCGSSIIPQECRLLWPEDLSLPVQHTSTSLLEIPSFPLERIVAESCTASCRASISKAAKHTTSITNPFQMLRDQSTHFTGLLMLGPRSHRRLSGGPKLGKWEWLAVSPPLRGRWTHQKTNGQNLFAILVTWKRVASQQFLVCQLSQWTGFHWGPVTQ